MTDIFRAEGASLVRLARLFVDDRNAAEDLVQEAFIRLARSVHRIEDPARAPAYLRSIVLNLARDHNRRGLVSLRHRSPLVDVQAGLEDEIAVRDAATASAPSSSTAAATSSALSLLLIDHRSCWRVNGVRRGWFGGSVAVAASLPAVLHASPNHEPGGQARPLHRSSGSPSRESLDDGGG